MRSLLTSALFLLAASCSPVTIAVCGPANCSGCCDTNDLCQRGDGEAACGARGGACTVCGFGNLCRSGVCAGVGGGVPGGGPGGGSAGGGSVGGGVAGGLVAGGTTAGGSAGGGAAGGMAGGLGGGTAGGMAGGLGGGTGGGVGPRCRAGALRCGVSTTTSALSLLTASPGGGNVRTMMGVGGVFTSVIDARAGGINPTSSGVHVRFGATGLERSGLTDVEALSSMDWDLSFKRAVVRLNSGDSGPSCVDALRVAGEPALLSLQPQPSSAPFREEAFMSQTCALMPDASGISGQPATVLADWYRFTNCVATTGAVFVIRTQAGRQVAFTIEQYYELPGAQALCNMSGALPANPNGGVYTVRWRFLN